MAETSLPWANNGVGDGRAYIDDEWSDTWRKFYVRGNTLQGVLSGNGNALEVTNPAGLNISVNTGCAVVDGKFYENTAANAVGAVVDPGGGGTNYYTVILRKTWATQEVRLAMLGPSGVGYPAVTQTDGVIWEIALADVSVTGGVVTVTDVREYCHYCTRVNSAMVDTDALLPVNCDPTMKWVRIDQQVVNPAGIVEFANIPQIYSHLLVRITGKSSFIGAGWDSIDLMFNDDAGNKYDYMNYSVINDVPSTAWNAGDPYMQVGILPFSGGVAAELPSAIDITILNYTNTTYYKLVKSDSPALVGLAFSWGFGIDNGQWEDTDAIIKITLTPHSAPNTFAVGSIVSLYGIC